MDTFPDAQLVCLGTGDPDLEAGLRWLEAAHPDRARAWVGFNVPFSHQLTAAADCLLMPSRFEPCGLNQLYAMVREMEREREGGVWRDRGACSARLKPHRKLSPRRPLCRR